MGYLINKNPFQVFNFNIDFADIISCGSSPFPLKAIKGLDFNGTNFLPLTATIRVINQTTPYDFGANSHICIQYTSPRIVFIWNQLINTFAANEAYQSFYIQSMNNFGGDQLTNNTQSFKNGSNLVITTYDGGDATQGDGQINLSITGYYTKI